MESSKKPFLLRPLLILPVVGKWLRNSFTVTTIDCPAARFTLFGFTVYLGELGLRLNSTAVFKGLVMHTLAV